MWKSIGNTNYQVSDSGEVMNTKTGKTLKQCKRNKGGYLAVDLCVNGVRKTHFVHRLVAEAFIPNPEGKPQIDHYNDNPEDNRVENLHWVTSIENVTKEHRIRLVSQVNKKVIVETNTNTNETRTWNGLAEAAEHYGITVGAMSDRIINHRVIRGVEWRYAC